MTEDEHAQFRQFLCHLLAAAKNKAAGRSFTSLIEGTQPLVDAAIAHHKTISQGKTNTVPTAHSATYWHVGLHDDGDTVEVRIVLRSKDEARAWAAWGFDQCGAPDPQELTK